jgi:GTP-binding protein
MDEQLQEDWLERRLREDFDFAGSPIEISVRVRERQRKS